MSKTDPKREGIGSVGPITYTVPPYYQDWTVVDTTGGTVQRDGSDLNPGETLVLNDSLTFTPLTPGGTVTLVVEQANAEFSGQYADLSGLPDGAGGASTLILDGGVGSGVTPDITQAPTPRTYSQIRYAHPGQPLVLLALSVGLPLTQADVSGLRIVTGGQIVAGVDETVPGTPPLFGYEASGFGVDLTILTLPVPLVVPAGAEVRLLLRDDAPRATWDLADEGNSTPGAAVTLHDSAGTLVPGRQRLELTADPHRALGRLPLGGMRSVTAPTANLSAGDFEIVDDGATVPSLRYQGRGGVEYTLLLTSTP